MSFVGKVWKILVGIKDGLVLLFMLLFFVTLFAILSARPNPGQVRDGALLIDLDGVVVEEKSALDPIEALAERVNLTVHRNEVFLNRGHARLDMAHVFLEVRNVLLDASKHRHDNVGHL